MISQIMLSRGKGKCGRGGLGGGVERTDVVEEGPGFDYPSM
jgi:hypothetical protein